MNVLAKNDNTFWGLLSSYLMSRASFASSFYLLDIFCLFAHYNFESSQTFNSQSLNSIILAPKFVSLFPK